MSGRTPSWGGECERRERGEREIMWERCKERGERKKGERVRDWVWVCERDVKSERCKEIVYLCVVCAWERERERERERESVCVCVCVWERERDCKDRTVKSEREREREREGEREREWVCMREK